jgi:hypothetical protein
VAYDKTIKIKKRKFFKVKFWMNSKSVKLTIDGKIVFGGEVIIENKPGSGLGLYT